MTFGDSLKDQLPDIDKYTINGIQFLQEFREFLKERVTIEQQYALAMDKLAKNYIRKFKKSGQSFYGAGNPLGLANPDAEALNTVANAFLRLLTETETMAKSRNTLAEKYSGDVSSALKAEVKRKDDARVKHLNYSLVLAKNFDAQRAEVDAARGVYRTAAREQDSSYLKYEKARTQGQGDPEKVAKEWNEVMVDKVEKKNEYILALASLNAHKKKFYFGDMPILMNHMEVLNEHITQRGKEIMTDYVNLDNQCLQESQASNAGILQALEAVNPTQDSALFVQLISKPWTEQADFQFETAAEYDKGELSTDVTNVSVLSTLQKNLTEIDALQKEIAAQTKTIDGIKTLKDAYDKDSKLGDPVEVWQTVIEAERTLLLKESQKAKYQTQNDVIRAAVGDVTLVAHQTKPVSSGTCVICQQGFSLFSKGLTCTACPVKAHTKCMTRIPPRCGTEFTPPPQLIPAPSGALPEAAPTGGATKLARKATSAGKHHSAVTATASSLSTTSATGSHSPNNSTTNLSLNFVGTALVQFDFAGSNPGDLAVKAGEVINVVEQNDGNGWMTAELRGVKGVLPADYAEMQANSPATAKAAKRRSMASSLPAASPTPAAAPAAPAAEKVKALYDYAAQSDVELTIQVGDVIEITNKGIGGGWWEGKLKGKVGQFPENYVEPA